MTTIRGSRTFMSNIDLSQISALLVEDDPGGIAIIGALLRRSGIKTYVDSTGLQVPERLHEIHPTIDIVLLDLKLPYKTGFEILSEIRANPLFTQIPVVAVTALDASIAMPQCREAGFDGYIAKPLHRSQFLDQIKRVLCGEGVWES